MESGAVIIFIMMINVCYKSDTKLIVIPRDTEVKINDPTYMNCSTSLRAHLVQWRHGNNYVYTALGIIDPYNNGRFSIEINASTGASNLVIRSVQPSDAGKYECSEDDGFGETRSARLIILDADPICKSDMHSGGVIGPNSCGIKPDEIQLSCSVTYHGNIPPILQWKTSADNQSVTDGLINVTFNNNEVTYTLTMKTSLDLSNASFICQTTTTSESHHSCSSEAINILYVFTSEVTINATLNDEIHCFANTSQTCSYKWKWFSGGDITTESDNQVLKPKKVGWHRCEATCSFGTQSCTVDSMCAVVHSATATSKRHLLPLLVLLLIPAVAVISAVVYWRKKKEEQKQKLERGKEPEHDSLIDGLPEKYKYDPVLVYTIVEEDKKLNDINGLAILDEELFVVRWDNVEVDVYDSMKFSWIRRWNLKELNNAFAIVSWKEKKCLYFCGSMPGDGSPKAILRVDPNGNFMMIWPTGDDYGWGLSVTKESNVILTCIMQHKLNEYSSDGHLIREINLSDAVIQFPWHAIKIANGHFVVSNGFRGDIYGYDDMHRVCEVDSDGKVEVKKSFGSKRGSAIGQMNHPIDLSVDENGYVMVADLENSRVLLLDSELNFKREILSKEGKHGLRRPKRILQDQENGRLFVPDNDWTAKRISVFKLKMNENS